MIKHILLLLLLFMGVASTASANSARVISLVSGVESSLAGKITPLALKMDVPIKSTVKSDLTGKAQFMFPDGATVSVAPDTEIALSEFVETPEQENIVLNLSKGTARIITGEVSKRNPQAFTVNTPQATIGIRGTILSIAVKGDETKIYLTETSGKGVYVQDKVTGNSVNLRTPGNMVTVSPQGMEQRKPAKGEVAAMTASVKATTAQATAQAQQTAQTQQTAQQSTQSQQTASSSPSLQTAAASPAQVIADASGNIGNKPAMERDQKLVADAGTVNANTNRTNQKPVKEEASEQPSISQKPEQTLPSIPKVPEMDIPTTNPVVPNIPVTVSPPKTVAEILKDQGLNLNNMGGTYTIDPVKYTAGLTSVMYSNGTYTFAIDGGTIRMTSPNNPNFNISLAGSLKIDQGSSSMLNAPFNLNSDFKLTNKQVNLPNTAQWNLNDSTGRDKGFIYQSYLNQNPAMKDIKVNFATDNNGEVIYKQINPGLFGGPNKTDSSSTSFKKD